VNQFKEKEKPIESIDFGDITIDIATSFLALTSALYNCPLNMTNRH
jgi:hypothetical protein